MKERPFRRYTSSDIHWRLIEVGKDRMALDEPVSDDGYVAAQALFCPYYNTIEGTLGSDWGVILNPESVKFGQLVFEHEWCGCPVAKDGEPVAVHGPGKQRSDEWVVAACKQTHTFRSGAWDACVRPKNHKGLHQGRLGSWRRPGSER